MLQKSHGSEIDCHRNPGGDFRKYSVGAHMIDFANTYNSVNKQSLSCEVIQSQPIKAVFSQSADTLLSNINDCSKSVEAYHCYCLNILLIAIKLTSPALAVTNAEIRYLLIQLFIV